MDSPADSGEDNYQSAFNDNFKSALNDIQYNH